MCKKFIKNGEKIKQVKKNHWRFSGKAYCVLAIILFVTLGVYYLGLINDRATVGYKILKLETRAKELAEINRNLELTIIDLRDMNRISRRAGQMKMVAAENTEYLTAVDEGVAMR